MKLIIWSALFLLLISAVPAISQTVYANTMKVNIPFDFVVNGVPYSAGEYTLRLNGPQDNVMLGSNGNWVGIHQTWNVGRTNEAGATRLVFTEENGKHILHQIWIAGQDHGHDLLHEPSAQDVAH